MNPIQKDGDTDVPSYFDTWAKGSNPLQQRVLQLSNDLEATKRENVLLAADLREMIQLRSELQFRKRQLSALHEKLEERDRQLLHLNVLVRAFYKSRSWRYSLPGRIFGKQIRWFLKKWRHLKARFHKTCEPQHKQIGIPKDTIPFDVNAMTPDAQEVYSSLLQRIDDMSHRDSR